MTSLRKRIKNGEPEEIWGIIWEHRGTTPLCCVTSHVERIHFQTIHLMKCDSSPWLTQKEFKKYCLKCQKEIAIMLGCSGCAHEAMEHRWKKGKYKPKGMNRPSGEMACMLCIRNPEYKEWYEDAKKYISMPKKWDLVNFFLRIHYGIKIIQWRFGLWWDFRESKRKDMYMTLEEFRKHVF